MKFLSNVLRYTSHQHENTIPTQQQMTTTIRKGPIILRTPTWAILCLNVLFPVTLKLLHSYSTTALMRVKMIWVTMTLMIVQASMSLISTIVVTLPPSPQKHADNDLEQNTPTTSNCMFTKIQASHRNHYLYINGTDQWSVAHCHPILSDLWNIHIDTRDDLYIYQRDSNFRRWQQSSRLGKEEYYTGIQTHVKNDPCDSNPVW